MKTILFLMLFAQSAFAAVMEITPIAVDNPDHKLPANLICLTQEWASVDEILHTKILALKELAPAAFEINGAENPNYCYDPSKVPEQNKVDFDYVLNLMQEKTNRQAVFPTMVNPQMAAPSYQGSVLLRNQDQPFSKKFWRATAYVQGAQLASVGILLVVPKSVSKWSDHPYQDAIKHWKRAYTTPPVWDKDDFLVNAGHPYAGAIYYNLVRSQGATMLQSFLYSTFQSVWWEYGIEAGAEQPSITDLITTSPIGSIFGELTHRATLKMAQNGFNSFGEKALVLILNPSYVLNNGFKVKHRTLPMGLP